MGQEQEFYVPHRTTVQLFVHSSTIKNTKNIHFIFEYKKY
jgi:hypothetical protein